MKTLIVFLCSCLTLFADTTVISLDRDVVKAAVDAETNGATINLPAGAINWTTNLVLSHRVKLIGAGTNATFITNSFSAGLSSQHFISFPSGTDVIQEVSGITFVEQSPGATISMLCFGAANSNMTLIRVHGCVFTNLTKAGVSAQGFAIGTVDHNYFYSKPTGSPTGVRVYGEGDNGWTNRVSTWGDTNRIYIEYNYFQWNSSLNANGAVDSYYGARYAFRYNTVLNVNVGNHGLDSTGVAGSHSFEVYGNNFTNTTGSKMLLFSFRGGTGLIFSNNVTGNSYDFMSLQNYRTTGTNIYHGTTPCCNPWGPVSNTNRYDGLTDEYGYPPLQQIGQTGPIIYHTGVAAPNGLGTNGYSEGITSPVYIWENWHSSTPIVGVVGNNYVNTGDYAYIPSATNVIQSGRDFINGSTMPGYTPLGTHPFYALTEGGNTPPTISAMTNITIAHDTSATNSFTIADTETAVGSLTVSVATSDASLTPTNAIVLVGETANRQVEITPATGLSGSATITVTVSDGTNSASSAFILTVTPPTGNTSPTLSAISNQTMAHDTTLSLAVTYSDAETAYGSLLFIATSSNSNLLVSDQIVNNGSGYVFITPEPGWSGQTLVTLTITDAGGLTASRSFLLTVSPDAAPSRTWRRIRR